MKLLELFQDYISPYWRPITSFTIPIILLPLPLVGTKEAQTGYVILIMAIYWMTEALPLPITSLIPVVAFPLFGIMNTGQVCVCYFTETVMMFMGGLIVGLAVEYCNLHKRIALYVILLVGTQPKWLMFGFMMVTMFLSMWVSNTGATAMIVPIVEALTEQLFSQRAKDEEFSEMLTDDDANQSFRNNRWDPRNQQRFRVSIYLSVAYAANIGGTATLIGSVPPLVLKGVVEELYGTETGLTFTSWLILNMPCAIVNCLLTWIWLTILAAGFHRKSQPTDKENEREVQLAIKRQYDDLGSLTFHEKSVSILFIILIFLWMSRDPRFIVGWASFFSKKIGDSVPVVAVILILFFLPKKWNFWSSSTMAGQPKVYEAMLDWNFLNSKLPWGLILLLGSGFAVSEASKISGLSELIASQLSGLQVLPPFLILLIVCILATCMTEVVSNTATANIVLPIASEIAEAVGINPLYLMVPTSVTCNYSFLLAVGTPPNAMVFSAGRMVPMDMIKAGIVVKLVCVLVLCAFMETLGKTVFPSDLLFDKHSLNSTHVSSIGQTLTTIASTI